MPGRRVRVQEHVGGRALKGFKGFFTPWNSAYLVAWMTSVFTQSWAWFFVWGLARIMKFLHDFMLDVVRLNEEEQGAIIPNGFLGGVVSVGGFLIVTAWMVIVFLVARFLGWDARPI